jgi:hypothetical protein
MALDTNTFLIVLAAAIIVMAFVVWASSRKFRDLCPMSQSGADGNCAASVCVLGSHRRAIWSLTSVNAVVPVRVQTRFARLI